MLLEQLNIEAGHNTPLICFDQLSGDLILKGKSIPENASQVYKPMIEWVKDYIQAPKEETNLHLDLIYFNTASFIWIAKIITALSTIDDREKMLFIHFYFHIEEFDEMDQEDIQEAIRPILDVLHLATVSMGVKIYGKDDFDSVVKEKLILL